MPFVEGSPWPNPELRPRTQKVAVIMPAYWAEKTIEATWNAIPKEWVDDIILTDDASGDRTVEISRGLGIHVLVHPVNRGYGGNQKTCYAEALRRGADIVVMVHPDHQYDPQAIPRLILPILDGSADAVFGSRMLGRRFVEGGMPRWKFVANVLLTAAENVVFNMYLTEYHSGFRAYSRRYLEAIAFEENSDGFVFDTEIIAQGVLKEMRIEEIPITTRYFPEASQIGFGRSCIYGLRILVTMGKFVLHNLGIACFPQFR
ncbi:MAG: glycosyltransferase family 2 protein [Candidatus Wallbacteria bacterium]|nr:glycosyltransferase family 2 protein [Candidatus Wallbacteria bacterium]